MREERSGLFRRLAIAGAACVGLGTAAAVAGFVGFVWSLDRVERDPPVSADAIVALTGGAQRIGDAIELLARGFGHRLLITGVNERTSREEIARLSPGQRRLVECCVDLDYRARNTVGNAEETRRWVRENGFGSLIVVTSNYHMPRTMAELDHALPQIRKVPHPVVSPAVDPAGWWSSPSAARLLASEYAKYVMVAIRTRLSSGPAADPPVREAVPRSDELARR
ncbi:YdcF family protein [Enterovirga sp. DB1703]|uniref:YdcF family protein n=2 Tax=Enterovirga aerilata TaxID=2730920 RepID=A0A849I1X7_9HYPH|nr:YdcF family protein [Enterovirga sp. DB1703]NNM71361.1 YdcF family protein [Enterovirga sp. DB1703]